MASLLEFCVDNYVEYVYIHVKYNVLWPLTLATLYNQQSKPKIAVQVTR